MQFVLNNISKGVVLAVFGFFILIPWYYGRQTVVTNGIFTEQSIVVPVETVIFENSTPHTHDTIKKSDSIWKSITHEFQLDHQAQSTAVKAEIRKLLADQKRFYQILKAAGPYIYFIYQKTQEKGLPAEMALIPIIESEFNPNDISTKGAAGLWQLMSGTARELGIRVLSTYDGRRNVVASTTAALAYLNDLGRYFKGNWYLALAAYNAGQIRIDKAIRKTGSKSFWNLPLPRETKYYVPKLLAVAAIIKDPKKYGVQLPEIYNKPYFIEIKFKKSLTLAQIAKSSGIQLETLRTLNPDYKNGTIIPRKGTYTLLVPMTHAHLVKSKFEQHLLT